MFRRHQAAGPIRMDAGMLSGKEYKDLEGRIEYVSRYRNRPWNGSVLVYVRGKGVVLKEPSVVAFDRDTNVIKAIGEEARMMLGRTPGNIVAVRPLRQGVISDYTVTEKMIKYFVQKALGKRTFKKPRISICVPSGVTEVEKRRWKKLPSRPEQEKCI